MSGFKNYDDRLFESLETVWDQGRQRVNDPDAWMDSGVGRMFRMSKTRARVPRTDSALTVVPWQGDRVEQGFSGSDYKWRSYVFETTLGLDRDEFSDLDQVQGLIDAVGAMGAAAAKFPNEVIFPFFEQSLDTTGTPETYTYTRKDQSWSWSTHGYDDVPLFSVHPNGNAAAFTNFDGSGTGNPYWYLLDSQAEQTPTFLGEYRPFDFYEFGDDVSWRRDNKRRWGQDARYALATGDPRSVYASSLALTVDNLQAAMTVVGSWQNEDGSPANIVPDTLLVPNALQFDAREVIKPLISGGETNVMQGGLRIVVSRYLNAVAP